MIYGKHKDDKRFGPVDLAGGRVGVGLVFATLIPDLENAKGYADELMKQVPDFNFQVRVAGKSKIVYVPNLGTEGD
jgi:hypothetical protein